MTTTPTTPSRFQFGTVNVLFSLTPELVEELNDKAAGFPAIEQVSTASSCSITRHEAMAWALAEAGLSREALLDADIAHTLLRNTDSDGLGKLTPDVRESLSESANAFVDELLQQLLAQHHAAREKLEAGGDFCAEDLFLGLREGDAVLVRTDTGELPCLVTEVTASDSMFGAKHRYRLAYLSIRSNGMLSWHRYTHTMSTKGFHSAKNAQMTLLSGVQRAHALVRGKTYLSLASSCRYAMCRGALMVSKGWSTFELPLEGRVMADPLGSSRTVPRVAGQDDAFGPDYPVSPLPEGLESYLTFVPQWVPGFSFKHKMWGLLSLDALHDIEFRDQAFEQLVLPADVKKTVHALVKHSGDSFSDIIDGKSGGCIFLLYGPPGAGKTLTAEAVAETLHRPLYVVNVGELGTTPDEVERALKQAFQTAERWNAVVLLDEADIFLERRTSSDIVRNALVGIFLRELEYYRGVLFLTTNRAQSLDPACLSRISLGLRYTNLAQDARHQVWKNLATAALGREPDICLAEFAKLELNGRQIKNALRLALTLGKAQNQGLTAEHLRTATGLTLSFMEDCHPEPFEPEPASR